MRHYTNYHIISKKDRELRALSFEESYERDEIYHKRYRLSEEEYRQKWLPIQHTLFDPNATWFPSMMFLPGLELFFMPLNDEAITRKQLSRLKKCMRVLGEKSFVVIENERQFLRSQLINPQIELTNFKYPATITYTKMLDGGRGTLLTMQKFCAADHFVFGESGQWGLYTSSSDEADDFAVDILGFRKEVAPLFTEVFQDFLSVEEKQYIREVCLPHMPAYQDHDKYLK